LNEVWRNTRRERSLSGKKDEGKGMPRGRTAKNNNKKGGKERKKGASQKGQPGFHQFRNVGEGKREEEKNHY